MLYNHLMPQQLHMPTDEELIRRFGFTKEHLMALRNSERAQSITDAAEITFCTNPDGSMALLRPQPIREDFDPESNETPIVRAIVSTELGDIVVDFPLSQGMIERLRIGSPTQFLELNARMRACWLLKQKFLSTLQQ